MHPSIAPIAAGAALHGTAPKFQYPDGLWRHGEGFLPGAVDTGGWFAHDDGTGLQSADVQTSVAGWVPYTWSTPLHPQSGAVVERLQGYLRPAGLALPTQHPRYGNVGPYVDQGAFEIFRPNVAFAGQKVLIVIQCSATTGFPAAYKPAVPGGVEYFWWNTYRGYFSPDGLVRTEFANGYSGNPLPGTPEAITAFLANTNVGDVERFEPAPVATWYGHPNQAVYYPTCGYPVLSVMHPRLAAGPFGAVSRHEDRPLQLHRIGAALHGDLRFAAFDCDAHRVRLDFTCFENNQSNGGSLLE